MGRGRIGSPGAGNAAISSATSARISRQRVLVTRAGGRRPRGRSTSATAAMCCTRQSARGQRGRADPHPGRVEGLARVVGHRVVVDDDPGPVEGLRRRLARHVLGGEVDEDQVVVGAAGDQVEAARQQPVGERPGVGDDRVGVVAERRLRRLVQGDRDGGRGVVVRPALEARGRPPCRSPWRAPRGTSASRRAARAASCAWSWRSRRRAATGDGCAPPAIRPAMCAMSATRTAPDSRAISAKAAKSIVRGSAVPPQKISFGRSASASSRTWSKSMRPVSWRTPYCTPRNHLPVAETPQPWVRWPPMGSAMPMTVSPGSAKAR